MKIGLSVIIIIVISLISGWWLKDVYGGQPVITTNTILAQQLLDKAEQLQPQPTALTMLLEIESLRRMPSPRGELLLRESLAVLSHTTFTPQPITQVQKVLFSSNGQWLASSQADNTVQLWHYDVMASPQLWPITTLHHQQKVTALAFSPNNQWLATSGEDGLVYIWSLPLGQLFTKQQFYQEAIESLAFSPDSLWLVLGSRNQVAYLWPLTTSLAATRRLPHPAAVNMAEFSPDGSWLATVSQSEIEVWEMAEARQVWQMPHQEAEVEAVTSITFSPNQQWLATADWTGEVHLWALHPTSSVQGVVRPVAPQIQLQKIQHERNFWTKTAFSHDSQFLAASGGNSVKVWQLAASVGGLTVNMTATTFIQHQDWVTQITFDSQKNWLISASLDGAVQVTDLKTQQLVNYLAHNAPVLSLALHPNNLVLATASGQTIQLWQLNGPDNPLSTTELITSACNQLPYKSLTQTEWQQYLGAEPYRQTCWN